MHRTEDADRWITQEADPWILAAAHAGDIRAMRFAARRVTYGPSDGYRRMQKRISLRWEEAAYRLPSPEAVFGGAREATVRERVFWYIAAAEHGDPESIAELVDEKRLGVHLRRARARPKTWEEEGNELINWLVYSSLRLRPDHQEAHLRRLLAAQGADSPLAEQAIRTLIGGDAESVTALIDRVPPHEHRLGQLLRRLAAARYQPGDPGAGTCQSQRGWWGIGLCEAGARDGHPPCMNRWDSYRRNHSLEYQADLRRWQEQAEQDLVQEMPPNPPPRFGGPPVATIVITAAVTSGLVPFVQAMIAKAGEDSYAAVRRHLKALFGKAVAVHEKPDREDQLLIVRPSEAREPGAVLQIWTDLPDEAVSALGQLLYDLRAAQPPPGVAYRWYWNGAARRWENLQLPRDRR